MDNHMADALLDQRHVTDELDRVAKPLLGVEKNPTGRESAAVPSRLRKFADIARIGDQPAVLIGPPPVGKIAGQQQKQRAADPCMDPDSPAGPSARRWALAAS